MIGRLTGVIAEKQAPHLLMDIQGVGYELQAPMTTFYRLPEIVFRDEFPEILRLKKRS